MAKPNEKEIRVTCKGARTIKRWIIWKERHHQDIDLKRNGAPVDWKKFVPELL